MSFGERIKQLRVENKWTQESVSEKLNISMGALSRYETGMYEPKSLKLVKDFASLFNVTTDFLLEKSDVRNPEEIEIDTDKINIELSKKDYVPPTKEQQDKIEEFAKFVLEDNELEEDEEKNNTIIHKDNSLNRLDLSFLKHIKLKEFKTSNLLAYWIKDFAVYHDEEKNFDTTKMISFKRGNVIKANLGFNIGHELGGLHYCVVLDKFDNPKNGTLNVIPLTSKRDKKYPKSSIDLGNEIYDTLNTLYSEEVEKLSNKYKDIWSLPNEKIAQFTTDFEYVKKIKNEISKMKIGSIALVNQITTISKQRIFDDDILRKVRLSKTSLDLLDKSIIKFFTK